MTIPEIEAVARALKQVEMRNAGIVAEAEMRVDMEWPLAVEEAKAAIKAMGPMIEAAFNSGRVEHMQGDRSPSGKLYAARVIAKATGESE